MDMLLFDFAQAAAVQGWTAIDDRVMGGLSRSALSHDTAGHARFQGEVRLDHGGGFASVRSPTGGFGLHGAGACVIEVRGDGRHYKLSLFTDDGFDSPNHQAGFAPAGTAWQAIRLPLPSFRATYRGRLLPGAPPLDPAHIRQVGLMIAGGQAGPFVLEIRSIRLVPG